MTTTELLLALLWFVSICQLVTLMGIAKTLTVIMKQGRNLGE